MTVAPPPRWLSHSTALFLLLAHTLPLGFYSNQNQYFLHGLADAGYGDLDSDWLANTRDPTPLFSLLVKIGVRNFGMEALYGLFLTLLFAYFLSLWHLVFACGIGPRRLGGWIAFALGMIVVHAAIIRAASVMLTGVDYPWYLQAGVANQYLLGPGLQPSVFGVLLLTALTAFAQDRPITAGILCAMACWFHSTYLLPAGLLVVGMMFATRRAGRANEAWAIGFVAFVFVAPVIVFILLQFGPTDAATFAEAQRVIAWVRIPHHTDVNRWLDPIAGLQLAGIVLGLLMLRKTSLFPVLLVATGLALLLSIVQFLTGSATLALLFPWRISAVLMPLATAVVLARGARLFDALPMLPMGVLAAIVVVFCLFGAMRIYTHKLGYQQTSAEVGMLLFIAEHRQPGEVYLLPTGFPPPAKSRGSSSSTFMPVTQTLTPTIFELQRFRLTTGAAAFIDFKSIPYQDAEVLEWQRRVTKAAEWYAIDDWDAHKVVEAVRAEGITHVVVPAGRGVHSRQLVEVFRDESYAVYRLQP